MRKLLVPIKYSDRKDTCLKIENVSKMKIKGELETEITAVFFLLQGNACNKINCFPEKSILDYINMS